MAGGTSDGRRRPVTRRQCLNRDHRIVHTQNLAPALLDSRKSDRDLSNWQATPVAARGEHRRPAMVLQMVGGAPRGRSRSRSVETKAGEPEPH